MSKEPSSNTPKHDGWTLYCEAYRALFPNQEFVSETTSPAALQEMVDRLVARSERVASGWAIQHADRKRWRTMDTLGCPDWTDDKAKALVCRLKEHIEAYAADDDEDIRILQVDW